MEGLREEAPTAGRWPARLGEEVPMAGMWLGRIRRGGARVGQEAQPTQNLPSSATFPLKGCRNNPSVGSAHIRAGAWGPGITELSSSTCVQGPRQTSLCGKETEQETKDKEGEVAE